MEKLADGLVLMNRSTKPALYTKDLLPTVSEIASQAHVRMHH